MQRIIKYISKTLYLLLLLTLFNGCAEIEPIDGKRNIDHTIIIYMAADNNLTGYVDDNIDKMRAAMNHDISINNNLILYVDKLNQKPCLLNIYNNKIDTIAVYQEMNSTDSQVFSRVIDQIIENYPSPSYGLIMWSHGSGWLHQNTLSYISSNIFGAQQTPPQLYWIACGKTDFLYKNNIAYIRQVKRTSQTYPDQSIWI